MDRAAVIRVSYEAVAPFSTPRGEAFGITLSLASSARFNASCGGMPVTPPNVLPPYPRGHRVPQGHLGEVHSVICDTFLFAQPHHGIAV